MKDQENARQLPPSVRAKDSSLNKTLPPVAELLGKYTILRYVDLGGVGQELDYRHLVDLDTMPIPMPVDREGYCSVEHSSRYWATGYSDWLNVSEAVKRYMSPGKSQSKMRLMDFGSATGRFLRHVWTFGKDKFDCWGCDFAPANVEWVKRYLSPEIKILLNTNVPHLPFPDGHFDIVTAFSVFTHIDYLEDAWLLELRRITSPNGLLYITVHNDEAWSKLSKSPDRAQVTLRSNEIPGNKILDESMFAQPLPEDRFVLRISMEEIYNCNVWISNNYIRKNWSRYFEIMQIAGNAHSDFQSVVIMKPLAEERLTDAPPSGA